MFIEINNKTDLDTLEDAVSYVYEDINIALDDFDCVKSSKALSLVFDELQRAVSNIYYVTFSCTHVSDELMNTDYEHNILNQFYEHYVRELSSYVNKRLHKM